MNRLNLFDSALEQTKAALARAPYMFPLQSVVEQLEYLIRLERGSVSASEIVDLETITIGQIAARDIDEFDAELADKLHDVSAVVAQMVRGK